jgi:hypothetical protein
MTIDDDRVRQLLQSTFPRLDAGERSFDLWARIQASRRRSPAPRVWLDLGLAAALAVLLTMFPEWLLLLAYHL